MIFGRSRAGSAQFSFHFVINLRNLTKIPRNLAVAPIRAKYGRGRIDRADIDRPWHGLGAVERSGKAGATLHRGSNDPIQGDRQ
jgi:hypothetical protein